MLAMLDDNEDRFAFSLEDVNPRDFTGKPMKINLNSDHSIFKPPHKLGHIEWDFVEAQCKKLEALGFIQCSTQSSYASATVLVRKKDVEGNYIDFRQCGDYRLLNMETTLDRYPLPGIEDIFNQIGGGYHLLKAGPAERIPPDASEGGGSPQNNILGSKQNPVGVAGGAFWTQERAPLFPAAYRPGPARPPFAQMLYR